MTTDNQEYLLETQTLEHGLQGRRRDAGKVMADAGPGSAPG